MKRIVRYCLSSTEPPHVFVIASAIALTTHQVETIVDDHPHVFSYVDQHIVYEPPFGIRDKASLLQAIECAFPKGIRTSLLNVCYEFAVSDLNELKYEHRVFLVKYGKTNEDIIFRRPEFTNDLAVLWQSNLDINLPYAPGLPFPKQRF